MSEEHGALVRRAARWLAGSRKCGLVMVEPQPKSCIEIPDAIGWLPNGHSVLVECKTSRSDFHRDKRKAVRTMGRERWYLAPPGVLAAADLSVGYGLLEPRGERLRRVVKAATDERPERLIAELPLLIWATRKTGWKLASPADRWMQAICIYPALREE